MQETVILVYCDLCFHIDNAEIKRESTHSQILGVGRKTYELEWCDDHDGKSFTIEETIDLFVNYGTSVDSGKALGLGRNEPPTRPKKGSGPSTLRYQCEHCDAPPYKRIDYYQHHLFKSHGIGEPPVMVACDFPGCTVVRERDRGIGNHKRRVHGIIGIQNRREEDLPEVRRHNAALYKKAQRELDKQA